MNDNLENNDFLKQMQDVNKLAQDKIPTLKSNPLSASNAKYRQLAAKSPLTKYENFLTDGDIEFVKPLDVLSYKIDGIQPNVFKNLKNAKYKIDCQLDLHRMTVEESRNYIFSFITSTEVEDLRSFIITHGKGERSQQPAKLKSYVNHWLRQIEQVVAFHSAQPKHGGVGSTYVLLKKPKQKRKINQIKYE